MKFCLLLLLIVIGNSRLVAQTSAPSSPGNFLQIADVLPPTPNSSALGKFGGIEVTLNSGTLTKTIPLQTFQYRDINVPISITYSTSGFKPDENPSYIGMSWVLNAGGTITREIFGAPDENSPRLIAPSQIIANQESFTFLENASLKGGGGDSEPDKYSYNFNGYTGKFVLDENMEVRCLPANNLKIEYNLTGSAQWNFKITTPDGLKYYFGGTSATDKTRKETSCGKPYEDYLPTSWHLTKIESPIGNAVNFSYEFKIFNFSQGLNESLISNGQFNSTLQCNGFAVPGPDCQYVPSTLCYSIMNAYGYVLTGITTSDGGSVELDNSFVYGNPLYSAIRIFDYNHTKIFDYSFEYEHITSTQYLSDGFEGVTRPFLVKLIETHRSSTDLIFHKFVYNDLQGLPASKTKSIDHWGYFNGKPNTSLVELPDDFLLRERFPTATANRNPDYLYAEKGVLSKIVYPTGGYDILQYEGNNYRGTKAIKAPLIQKNLTVTGTGFKTEVSSQTANFTTSESQSIKITYTFSSNGTGVDPIHHLGTVGIYSSSGSPVFEDTRYADNVTMQEAIYLPAGTYYFKVSADGSIVTTSSNLQVREGATTFVTDNYDWGGLRVKSVKTYNAPSAIPTIKKYYYHKLNTPNLSSGGEQTWPYYNKAFNIRKGCSAGVIPGVYTYDYCQYEGLYSYPLNTINLYPGGSSYEYVVEGFGENFENGAIEHHFRVSADIYAATFNSIGAPMVGAPVSNVSRFNSALLDKTVYKSPVNNVFEPVSKTVNTYKTDIERYKLIIGNAVNKSQITINIGPSQYYENVQAFEASTYNIVSHWEYIEKTEEFTYVNGIPNAPLITKYYYDNAQHMLLTRTETFNSKGELISTETSYPKDFSPSTSSNQSIQALYLMNLNGLLNSPVEVKKFVANGDGTNKRLIESILFELLPII